MDFYLLGIGGIGQSGLARILKAKGFSVGGSDSEENPETVKLRADGFELFIGHDAKNLPKDVFTVVTIPAITENNPEIVEAKKRGLRIITRTKVLAEIFADKIQLGVAGTHGKTTTTAMLAKIFLEAGLDPSFVIGGNLPGFGNARLGKGPHFIFEADEYYEQFLNFNPAGVIVLNVEPDHLDYYGDFEHVKEAFKKFISGTSAAGIVVTGSEVPKELTAGFKGTILRVGEGDSDISIADFRLKNGLPSFSINVGKYKLTHIKLRIPGRHNAWNAACAYVLALGAGVQPEIAETALSMYEGVERRFQIYADNDKFAVIDDYAHHPTEIAATLKAAKERFSGRRILLVFQPHQFSRTKFFLEDFARELAKADLVFLAPIMRVRDSDEDVQSITTADLALKIKGYNQNVKSFNDYGETAKAVTLEIQQNPGLVVMTMGAAPINKILPEVLNAVA